MLFAIEQFQAADDTLRQARFNNDLETARQWLSTTVRFQWRATQPPREQFNNSLTDIETLEALNETGFRLKAITEMKLTIRERIRTIKVSL